VPLLGHPRRPIRALKEPRLKSRALSALESAAQALSYVMRLSGTGRLPVHIATLSSEDTRRKL